MKKVMILTAILTLLLAGCSQLEPYLEKIPFLQKEANQSQEPVNPSEKSPEDNPDPSEESSGQSQGDEVPSLEAAFFNEIKVVDGKNFIQNPTNVMVLVNKQFSLPDGYAPEDLVRPNVPFSFGDQDLEKSYMRQEAATALEKMFADAKMNGIDLFAVSGYRSYARQSTIFDAEVNKFGKEKAVQAVAIPGSSEHQTGLAMDLSSPSANYELSEEFGETKEGKWIAENAHRFGFILRYPKGKEDITGYMFEPWHFRYVGTPAAAVIYEKKLTLEEYFNIVQKI
ncbi:M15 family metallopeptidase [Bacillus sp. FJAT-29790]|uniref:M15 family metallopeptidase n=1 Tax=Bacillus sp. FJAT-29790 TaxID=1895002 RepID=UPI001C250B56|nr:M15 family metallopeptidase [Bacillus sp. FJAT-29790]MBU8878924.1 M15 family metallopeptidase [Bacillus sp. FJAT-29790]